MALRPKKPCRYAGCPATIREGRYCPQHKKKINKQYDKEERNHKHKKFYDSSAWQKTRLIMLKRNPLCVADNCNSIAVDVDHIVSLKDNWDRRLSESNLQCLCKRCHGKKEHLHRNRSRTF